MSETSTRVFTISLSLEAEADPASALAKQTLVDNADADYDRLCDLFGNAFPVGPPDDLRFRVAVTDGVPGAFHVSCDNPEISVNPQIGGLANPTFTRYLLMCEVVEVLAAKLNNGWNCQKCHGEALSRVLAQELFPGVVERAGRTTAKYWLDPNDLHLNFVDPDTLDDASAARNSDVDPGAVGCGVLFLYWLHYGHPSQFSWNDIVRAGASTLGGVYTNLTDLADGFTEFKNAVFDASGK